MGMGMGMGDGSGNGYSARSTNLQNVGLYGGLPPLFGGEPRSIETSARTITGEPEQEGGAVPFEAANMLGSEAARRAAGEQNGVPARYQRRVADYFQRVADELEE
jgi:hypothetical protein